MQIEPSRKACRWCKLEIVQLGRTSGTKKDVRPLPPRNARPKHINSSMYINMHIYLHVYTYINIYIVIWMSNGREVAVVGKLDVGIGRMRAGVGA